METLLSDLIRSLILILTFSGFAFFGVCVYRLCLSPISHIPGPKVAAATFWYEFYHDVIRRGQYTWRIEQLHEQYGPVVRINPFEVHVSDRNFYDQIYVGPTRRTDKWQWSAKMFGTSQAAVGTVDHGLHRLRRGALNPFFSRRSVVRLEPAIQTNVDKLLERLRGFAGKEKPVNLSDAFACLSADVIGSYAFGKSYDFLNSPDFNPRWRAFMMDLSAGTMLMKQFGWAYAVLNALPAATVAMLHPLTRQLFDLRQWIANQIGVAQDEAKTGQLPVSDHPTIFHELFASNLPPSELTLPRLTDEALTIVGAGTVTTAHTLSVLVYHLLANPTKAQRLRAELSDSSPRGERRTWVEFEQLPYLSACISEGLRLSYGVSHRLQRVSPDTDLLYHDQATGTTHTIPAGTPVSMTQMSIHNDPKIFANPKSFCPERWLPDAEPPPALLKKWLIPFSRGTRACVGINLANAELFLTIGALFGPQNEGGVDMQLFETDQSDVEIAHDFFNPSARLDSQGVRVMVAS